MTLQSSLAVAEDLQPSYFKSLNTYGVAIGYDDIGASPRKEIVFYIA
jgi:hypothetical protein